MRICEGRILFRHCSASGLPAASSTMHSSGPRSAAADSRDNTPAATRNRSAPSAGASPSACSHSSALELGQPGQLVLDRANEAMKTSEVEVRLDLHPGHGQRRHPGRTSLARVTEQRALAHAGLASEDEASTLSMPSRR